MIDAQFLSFVEYLCTCISKVHAYMVNVSPNYISFNWLNNVVKILLFFFVRVYFMMIRKAVLTPFMLAQKMLLLANNLRVTVIIS